MADPHPTQFQLLLKLDSPNGLSVEEFTGLFSRCPCGRYFVRGQVRAHREECALARALSAAASTEVIDLTTED
jgi:hypothetical protein